MTQPKPASSSHAWVWTLLLLVLVTMRLPALARPAGGDQYLYSYTGGRMLEGDTPYLDSWDQKPPGIFFVYAAAWAVYPDERVIGLLDLAAAVATAALLVLLGRRMFGGYVGEAAAVLFLLLADPGIQRSGGMYLRAQCETFIALFGIAALYVSWRSASRPIALAFAGVLLALMFWLKYNAAIFVVPVVLAAVLGGKERTGPMFDWTRALKAKAWIAAGAIVTSLLVIGHFAARGALTDLWLATITYNVRYAGETYTGILDAVLYVFWMPIARARVDGLWFLGLLGLLLLVDLRRLSRETIVIAASIGAVVLSIAMNGSRGLPQYFIQATPILALAGAAGLTAAWQARKPFRIPTLVVALVLLWGVWRVGVGGPITRPRLFGIPQSVANVADDVSYLRGFMTREDYLGRYDRGEGGKFSLLAIERLVSRVRELTGPSDRAFVFGFAGGGVLVKSDRQSASRFFWSRPVVLEFEAGRPGYGSAGLLADLTRVPPSVVALQKHDWGLAETTTPDSIQFFMNQPQLRGWLEAGYAMDYEDAAFAVWRRKS